MSAKQNKWGRLFLWLLALGGSLLFLAGCADMEAARDNEHYQIRVVMADSQSHFEPSSLTVGPGATVTWTNTGLYPQTVTFNPDEVETLTGARPSDGLAAWESGVLYPGEDWSYTFDTPGTYLFVSKSQAMPKMMGVIEVTEAQ
ncbi:MAG: hypothetical protein H6659_12315 [Ardenticatenaceae bacterium]|nr:hypothetical protein [Ardenticatenaceae bacterium]